jgi:hypothetical protein
VLRGGHRATPIVDLAEADHTEPTRVRAKQDCQIVPRTVDGDL